MKNRKAQQARPGQNRRLIFVISGPSGSGKTTLLEKLFKNRKLKKGIVKSISFTTRPKRSGEVNARDYFFITQSRFREYLKAKKILEWTRYLGYYYATPRDFVEKQLKKGKHVILCLDLKGALRIKRIYPKNTVTIFIVPPSIESLRDRIAGRCNKTKKEEIGRRVELARQEILASNSYDYCIVNENLDRAAKELQGIVLKEAVS